MFDSGLAGLDEPTLLAAIERAACEESRAGARKSAAIAALVHESVTFDDVRDQWVWDSWIETACELGAVLNTSYRRASAQMRIALALRDRLPRVAALHAQGRLSARLIGQITWRTRLVQDPQLLALLDTAIAEKATRWEPLSDDKLTAALDAVIERYDPDAVIRAREHVSGLDFRVGASDDPDALVMVWGKILGCDAAVLAARIAELLKGLCDNDPRSVCVRRSHAVGAIVRGQDHLRCRCGSPDCTAAAVVPGSSNVVISVLADPAALDAVRQLIADQDRDQQDKLADKQAKAKEQGKAESQPQTEPIPQPEAEPEPEAEAEVEVEPEAEAETAIESEPAPVKPVAPSNPAACVRDSGVALLPGVKILPIVALAEAIRSGAAIKTLWLPGPDPEPHYRPSAKLAAFVRARDLFCRYPGCDVPAEHCDLDHVVPYPYGPTHPSNLNCKCRTHHLGKTFAEGWQEQQLPDGTVLWTTPAGQRCTTVPGSWLFFPGWDTTTAELPPMAQPPPDPDRLAKMPKRRRTRAADQAARIKAEREHNALQRALETERAKTPEQARRAEQVRYAGLPPPASPQPDYGNDPPPF
ncbi:HNH endonuclease signature motif containing protein [Mycolicibacterium austroafricanum]|uniref:HNH endonuclease signature motif containing protein n=1 Tax=Mycolicibacterium austroafricanum TaxID=39687 RepID=UPI001CA381D3|nr:HNH endonuclease signature motif containing protein [Mycolicibacterium austroafricanum]QZT56361.1 HNH endonuclease [Mycolicibacterium austroafricanum]